MPYASNNGYASESETQIQEAFAETPFVGASEHEQEEPAHEMSFAESLGENWEFSTPFLPGESMEASESEGLGPEVASFSEVTAELKDTLFREALEQLADEAMEAHAGQLSGEYADRETRDITAERLLNEHFAPLAAETEAMLDRFFSRL